MHEYLGIKGQLFGAQHVVEHDEDTRSHRALTYSYSGAMGAWAKSEQPPAKALRSPATLIERLDENVAEEECARLVG